MAHCLLIIGVNHRTAPVEIRERLAFGESEVADALDRLKRHSGAIAEAALLSTCNRVELVVVTTDPARAVPALMDFLATDRRVESAAFADCVYRLEGPDAARHLFRVGASLDSMVVGETQIFGQLKLAYIQAAEAGAIGMVLHRVFHKAFSVAKRVRRATLIGHGTVSVSSAAINLAKQIFDSLQDKTVLLIGAGKMAELTAKQLVRLGVASLFVTNRTFERASEMAAELNATAVAFASYAPILRKADIVIGSATAARPLLGVEEFEEILRERKYRPIFLIDLGVPRNFDERLNSLENVYLYDIDDLGKVVFDSQNEREREAMLAETIVEAELESFLKWFERLTLVPTIKDIRAGFEHLRESELRRHRAWLARLRPDERNQIESLTRNIINKICHQVMTELRRHNGAVDGIYAAAIARRLLGAEFVIEGAATKPQTPGDKEDDEGL